MMRQAPPAHAAAPGRPRPPRHAAAPRSATPPRSGRLRRHPPQRWMAPWTALTAPPPPAPPGLGDLRRGQRLRPDLDCGKAGHRRPQHLLAPGVEQPRADAVPVGHHLRHSTRRQVSRTIASLSPSLHLRRRSDRTRTSTRSGRALLRASYDPSFADTTNPATKDGQPGQFQTAPEGGGRLPLTLARHCGP